ncbi:MAG: DUF1854 domain-containing protein [Planctomycetota bacterium]|jgi:hypothetical protein
MAQQAHEESRTPDAAAGAEGSPGWLVRPEQVKVWEDPFRVLHVSVDGEEFENVRARQVFPISGKADYVSFLDESDREVALLARPHKLDQESRRALDMALGQMYYSARILRVDSITELMGVTKWEVETDRGYAVFEVVDRRQHVRKLPGGRLIIQDADGNRFEVENVAALDENSQTVLHSEM